MIDRVNTLSEWFINWFDYDFYESFYTWSSDQNDSQSVGSWDS